MAAQGEECNGNEWIRAAREKLGVTRPRKGIALIGIERMGNAKETKGGVSMSVAMEEIRRGARGTAKEKHAREERRKAKELL